MIKSVYKESPIATIFIFIIFIIIILILFKSFMNGDLLVEVLK